MDEKIPTASLDVGNALCPTCTDGPSLHHAHTTSTVVIGKERSLTRFVMSCETKLPDVSRLGTSGHDEHPGQTLSAALLAEVAETIETPLPEAWGLSVGMKMGAPERSRETT